MTARNSLSDGFCLNFCPSAYQDSLNSVNKPKNAAKERNWQTK